MRQLIAGNWKMHGATRELAQIAAIAAAVEAAPPAADLLICPPATLIARATIAASGRIAIGGQDCSAESEGAFTGDISTGMLIDAGATAVIVGHSERRRLHGETGAMIAAKARTANQFGLLTIICIGESLAQRTAGATLTVCDEQIADSLPDGMHLANTAVAHEPLWAIGSGRMPTAHEIVEVHQHIRSCLVRRFGVTGRSVRILYGGSVKPDNARAILALPDVDGALIGGASLKAVDFMAIEQSVTAGRP
jgi:triosephosphate isomerase